MSEDPSTPEEKRRLLRIESAVIRLVLHGITSCREGYADGFNEAIADLALVENATWPEITPFLHFALRNVPPGLEEPVILREHLLNITSWIEPD